MPSSPSRSDNPKRSPLEVVLNELVNMSSRPLQEHLSGMVSGGDEEPSGKGDPMSEDDLRLLEDMAVQDSNAETEQGDDVGTEGKVIAEDQGVEGAEGEKRKAKKRGL